MPLVVCATKSLMTDYFTIDSGSSTTIDKLTYHNCAKAVSPILNAVRQENKRQNGLAGAPWQSTAVRVNIICNRVVTDAHVHLLAHVHHRCGR